MNASNPSPSTAERVQSVLPEPLHHPTVHSLLRRSVAEDTDPSGTWVAGDSPPSKGDVTSTATVPSNAQLEGRLVAKEDGVVAGLPLAQALFLLVDASLSFTPVVEESDSVAAGQPLAHAEGPGRSLLAAERPALNLVGHLSGIATLTRRFVDAVAHTDATIFDTRKTLPGMRYPNKYAVRQGGGTNHRLGLFDMVLIKENHIAAAGGVAAALRRARDVHGEDYPVEVEVTTLEELEEALALEPDVILLDNMDAATLRRAVERTDEAFLEASGGITLDTVASVAETGVDRISVGALTHSAPALDVSLQAD